MSSALYVGLAAQTTLTRRLETLAANLANASTAGYRADGVQFASLVARGGSSPTAFPTPGADYITTRNGAIDRTGSPLDIAVRGDAWFGLMSASGPIYTRDGRLEMAATGELRSVTGLSLLDASGSPIVVDPAGGSISIAPDGAITQRGRQMGVVGLFTFEPDQRLRRAENASVTSDQPPAPATNFQTTGVLQGHIERSNVDPVRELTRLIEIQRSFDSVTGAMDMLGSTEQDSIRILGGAS